MALTNESKNAFTMESKKGFTKGFKVLARTKEGFNKGSKVLVKEQKRLSSRKPRSSAKEKRRPTPRDPGRIQALK